MSFSLLALSTRCPDAWSYIEMMIRWVMVHNWYLVITCILSKHVEIKLILTNASLVTLMCISPLIIGKTCITFPHEVISYKTNVLQKDWLFLVLEFRQYIMNDSLNSLTKRKLRWHVYLTKWGNPTVRCNGRNAVIVPSGWISMCSRLFWKIGYAFNVSSWSCIHVFVWLCLVVFGCTTKVVLFLKVLTWLFPISKDL